MKRRHSMPFGAEIQKNGSVRFRLWAPAARRVELALSDKKLIDLLPLEEGWFELVSDTVFPRDQYSFRIDERTTVPDPASRFQPRDVHGPSELLDPAAFEWSDDNWRGRLWEEAVIFEAHVGTFTPAGTFSGMRERLDYLADLGITALELMPVSDFPGKRNWGYDGVLPFAPDSSYGHPEDLKALVQSAHERGIMIFMDVVYNHFGPEGNYLRSYAPQFFTDRHRTPWGDGINFDSPNSRTVRDFFIHNALFWLTEYHFDGLRLDAVHAIADDSKPDILTELADAIRGTIVPDRHVHLILENDNNQAAYLQRTKDHLPQTYTAQWNDDIHHSLHVLLTGEREAYYSDFADRPLQQLGRCLTEGFAYQGEVSPFRKGERRGSPSAGLPPSAFISFLQNHDQVGNRAFGERITTLVDAQAIRAAAEILLLAPSPPMLFMGDEFGAKTPFLFFCDFEKDLAAAVTEGRRNEFAQLREFNDPKARQRIPDPNAVATFEASKLDWSSMDRPRHREWREFYRELLKKRREYIVPLISKSCVVHSHYETTADRGLTVNWKFGDGAELILFANLTPSPLAGPTLLAASNIYASPQMSARDFEGNTLPGWAVTWCLKS